MTQAFDTCSGDPFWRNCEPAGGAEPTGPAHRFGEGIDELERGDLDPLDDELGDRSPRLKSIALFRFVFSRKTWISPR